MSDAAILDVFDICSDEIGPATFWAVDPHVSEIGPSIDPGTIADAAKYVYDLLAYVLLNGELTNDLTPFVGIVTIQLDDIDGSLSLHRYHSAMAILIVEIAFDLDFEQRVTDTPAFIVATAVDIEYTQSDNMRFGLLQGQCSFRFLLHICMYWQRHSDWMERHNRNLYDA
jgi:hypothetical protein